MKIEFTSSGVSAGICYLAGFAGATATRPSAVTAVADSDGKIAYTCRT